MEFYARLDTGAIWPKRSEPTEREQCHLNRASGLVPWEIIEIDNTNSEMLSHVLAGHCIYDDDLVIVLPENEWPENIGGTS